MRLGLVWGYPPPTANRQLLPTAKPPPTESVPANVRSRLRYKGCFFCSSGQACPFVPLLDCGGAHQTMALDGKAQPRVLAHSPHTAPPSSAAPCARGSRPALQGVAPCVAPADLELGRCCRGAAIRCCVQSPLPPQEPPPPCSPPRNRTPLGLRCNKTRLYPNTGMGHPVAAVQCRMRERLLGVPGIQISVPAIYIPMLCPSHTELGVPFSQLQKHKSLMHDWKKWRRGSVMMTIS